MLNILYENLPKKELIIKPIQRDIYEHKRYNLDIFKKKEQDRISLKLGLFYIFTGKHLVGDVCLYIYLIDK